MFQIFYVPPPDGEKQRAHSSLKKFKDLTKEYKIKHQKAVNHRKGRVLDIQKLSGSCGGQISGISTDVSHSVRIKGWECRIDPPSQFLKLINGYCLVFHFFNFSNF